MDWKNKIQVDIDSDRKDCPVLIGKPGNLDVSKLTKEEWARSVIDDMATLCEGICTLIHVAEQNGLKSSHESVRDCIKHLQDGFADASYKVELSKNIKP